MSNANKNRNNYFDTEVAMDVGIMPAILYANISYWCEHNKENNKNEREGYYWTYNSITAFKKQFPYMSEKQIRTSLQKLEDKGYIKTGCYNEDACDKTKWYTDIRENALKTPSLSICPTGQMDLPHRADGFAPQGKPIPYINTNINTNNIIKETKAKKSMVETVLDEFPIFVNNPNLVKAYLDFAEMRKAKGKKSEMKTEGTVRTSVNKLLKLGGDNVRLVEAIINQSIERCWDGFFEVKESNDYFGDELKRFNAEKSLSKNEGQIEISFTTPLALPTNNQPSGMTEEEQEAFLRECGI